MKILFVVPKYQTRYGFSKPGEPHLGIAYLTSVLKNLSHEVRNFTESVDGDRPELKTLVESFKPDVMGFSVFSYGYKYSFNFINETAKYFRGPIIIGGPEVSVRPTFGMEKTKATFAVKGEGEVTLPELLDAINRGEQNLSGIKGVIWRDNGRIVENENRPFIEDLDSIPFPDYEAFPLKKFEFYSMLFRYITIISSRGCPYRCIFCSLGLAVGRKFRVRSPENVISEINHWKERGFYQFDFKEDVFNFDMKRVEKICDMIIENNMGIEFRFPNGIRADRIDDNLMAKLKKAGCLLIMYGGESGNDYILKKMKKGIKTAHIRNAVNLAKKYDIKCGVNFIFGHAYETMETARQTLDFARDLRCDYLNLFNMIPTPGTELYSYVEQHGRFLRTPEDYLNSTSYYETEPIFETDEFPKEERREILKTAEKINKLSYFQANQGKFFGRIAYLLWMNTKIATFVKYLFFENSFGRKIFHLTLKSKVRS